MIGGGSFGLAMASVVGKKGHPTCILVRKEDVSNSMPPKKVSGEEGRKGPCCGKLGGMVHGDGIPKHMLFSAEIPIQAHYVGMDSRTVYKICFFHPSGD